MAKAVRAYSTNTPRVKLKEKVKFKSVLEFIEGQSGLTGGQMKNAIFQIQRAIVYFNRLGMPVKIDGLGTYAPTTNNTGKIGVAFRADNELLHFLNQEKFQGSIINRDMIGKPLEAQIDRWNEEHPDDPVEKPAKKDKKDPKK